jgi:predicted Zn-dependent peptidase
MNYKIYRLKNGIRLVHSPIDGNIAYCGILVNTGSRDEEENEHGLAHFIEHALFKGTQKRRSYHILNRLESVGGDVNAFTTKEDTCIYTTFLNEHYERSLELLSDMFFNSNFPENEIEKEKDVIIDEINSYKDSPSELIFDDFEDYVFKNQALGKNILGIPKKIKAYTRQDLVRFKEKNYATEQTVIFSLGNIEFKRLLKLTEKYFGEIPEKSGPQRKNEIINYQPFNLSTVKKTHQLHCIIGNRAYDLHNEKRTALSLLNNLMGGTSMNSRLSMALREKSGFVYDIESNYTGYTDNGIFSLYFGTDKSKFDKSLKLIHKEFNQLKSSKLGVLQLKRAKQQMIGQIAISAENKDNSALNLGKAILLFDKIDSLEEVNRKIEAITANEIIEVANEILDTDKLSILVFE